MAYGTLETIYSSSKSSEEEKTKKKSAKVIAEEVRGRAAKKAMAITDMPSGSTQDQNKRVVGDTSGPAPKVKRPRSHSVGFATLLIDSAHGTKGDAASRTISPAALISEPARPQTSIAEQDLNSLENTATIVSTVPALARYESLASTLKPVSDQRPSMLNNLSSWLPWGRPVEPPSGSTSYAEGSLRQLLKATDGDRKGKNVDRAT
jgi:hypothetical protein